MSKKLKLPLLVFFPFLFLSSSAESDPLNEGINLGTSVSHAYQAQSTFTNPAALAFQTELNGSGFSTAFAYAANKERKDSHSLAISWGYFGFGLENLVRGLDDYSKFHFAFGIPIGQYFFLGTRYSLTRSDQPTIGSSDSWDMGAQIRPSRYFSFGTMAIGLNRPTVNAEKQAIRYVFGVTARPFSGLELSLDADTLSEDFAKTWGYQASVSYEFIKGLHLSMGYHDRYEYQLGLRLNLDRGTLFTTVQPNSNDKAVVFGLQGSVLPKKSALLPPLALGIEIDSTLVEEPLPGGFFFPRRHSLLEILQDLKNAQTDQKCKLIFIKINQFPLGMANAQEIYDALWKLRKLGKRIEIFLGNGGAREYLIASAAHKIHIQPGSQLNFSGLRFERLYWKGTLDKLGIKGELYAKGKYKSAPEAFQRKDSSPEVRKANLESLKRIETTLVKQLSQSGRVTEKKWKTMLNTALFNSEQAKAAGIVDEVSNFPEELKSVKRGHLIRQDSKYYKNELMLPGRVAVIFARGSILQQKSRLMGLSGVSIITPSSIKKKLKKAISDPRTKAIVIRVSSGGGEIAPSYEIASLIEQAKKDVPVIVSMGSAAASGGYLISAPADKVFAEPFTLTGSIGVFLGKANLSGLLEKIDLRKEIISHAPHAGLLSWDRPFSKEGQKIMLRQLNKYYDGFVQYVSKKRKLPLDKTEQAAQGRVWFGEKAKQLGLVDEIGGLNSAIHYAAQRASLNAYYEVQTIKEPLDFFDFFGGGSFAKTDESVLSLIHPSLPEQLIWIPSLRENPFLLWTPIEFY